MPPTSNIADKQQSILIRFRHGLGDAVQLTAVLRHLQHYHPGWEIDVAALIGKHSAFHGLCQQVFVLDQDELPTAYNRVVDLDWLECAVCYSGHPSTKVERCLWEVFGLKPLPDLCSYAIQYGDEAAELAGQYLQGICQTQSGDDGRYPAVLIHYEGNTSGRHKNLPAAVIRRLCEDVIAAGAVPVILDWDHRSPLPDGREIFNPHADLALWGGTGTGDAEVLAALIGQSEMMIGIDSGPLHVAGATATRTLGVWTGHHPLHYFGLSENVTHLIPADHSQLLRGSRETGERYFAANYRYQTYARDNLESAVRGHVREWLGGPASCLVQMGGFWIRNDNAQQDSVIVQDIADEDSYHVAEIPMPRQVVVDVGAHIGCFSKSVHRRNPLARIIAVECCPENISALRKNVGSFAVVLQAAVTYEPEIALLNSVYPGCVSTGGSTLVPRDDLLRRLESGEVAPTAAASASEYWADLRPIRTVTLEQILLEYELDRIDILKLDCEGSEFSILEHTTSLDRIGLIVGEYHGKDRFWELVRRRFSGWELRILKDGELGTFWLVNPAAAAAALPTAEPLKLQNVFVGTCTYNRYDLLERMLASLRSGTRIPQQIYVIDNGGQCPSLKGADVEIIRPTGNLGVAASWNLLHKLVGEGGELVLTNDDVQFGPRTLEQLLARPEPFVTAIDGANRWSCFLQREAVWREVGEYDEQFWPAYNEDSDYARRMHLAGVEIAVLPDSGVLHRRESTLSALPAAERPRWDEYIRRNAERYAAKWGGPRGRERFTVPYDGRR